MDMSYCVMASVALLLLCYMGFLWAISGEHFLCFLLGHKWVAYESESEWMKWRECERCGEEDYL